jgi:hypothetical protein
MPTPTPMIISAPVTKIIDAFTSHFPTAGKELLKWNQPAVLLIDEATKQATTEGFEILFSGYSEDWQPPKGGQKQDYPFTLPGYPKGSTYPALAAKVFVPKDPYWSGVQALAVLRAITHLCFELQNAKNSRLLNSIEQDARNKVIADGKTYAKRKISVEVDGGIRTGKMLDGAIYFNFISKANVDATDPCYTLIRLYYDSQNGVSKDTLVARTLQTKFVTSGITREQSYIDYYNANY